MLLVSQVPLHRHSSLRCCSFAAMHTSLSLCAQHKWLSRELGSVPYALLLLLLLPLRCTHHGLSALHTHPLHACLQLLEALAAREQLQLRLPSAAVHHEESLQAALDMADI